MNGDVRILLRNRTSRETEQVYAELTREADAGELTSGDINSSMYYLRLSQLLLACSVERLAIMREPGKPAVYQFPEASSQNYPQEVPGKDAKLPCALAYSDIIDKLPNEALVSMVLGAFRHFEALTRELLARADDPDFWKAAAGES